LIRFKKNGAQILEERFNNGRHVGWVAAPDGAQMELIARCVPGRSNRGFISGDAMAEAFRRAGSARKTPGQR